MHARRRYAVLWSGDEGPIGTGRLEVVEDRVELSSRDGVVSVPLASVTGARIARDAEERLRGLPALSLSCGAGGIRIACLEGTGALYEIARLVESESPALRVSGI
jgi:hypothetical protein